MPKLSDFGIASTRIPILKLDITWTLQKGGLPIEYYLIGSLDSVRVCTFSMFLVLNPLFVIVVDVHSLLCSSSARK